ncbi:hypothetical protein V8E54_006097 [Elaphomyces granulatus]
MTVSLKLNETKRRMVYVSLKRTETDTVYIQHWPLALQVEPPEGIDQTSYYTTRTNHHVRCPDRLVRQSVDPGKGHPGETRLQSLAEMGNSTTAKPNLDVHSSRLGLTALQYGASSRGNPSRANSTSTNRSLPQSDNIVLAPVTIHPDPSDTAILQPDEFTIKGQQYIRCSSLGTEEHKEADFGGLEVWRGHPIQA